VLYARVPASDKKWVEAAAQGAGISVADAVHALIVDARESGVRFQQRPPKVIR